MPYIMIRVALSAWMEIIYIRIVARMLTMHSKAAFYAIECLLFAVDSSLYSLQMPVMLRMSFGIVSFLVVPIVMSAGRLTTRIARVLLLYFAVMLSELLGGTMYAFLSKGNAVPDVVNAQNLTSVVSVYLILILTETLLFEMSAAICDRIDAADGQPFEAHVALLVLVSLLFFTLSYARLSQIGANTLRATLASVAYCWLSLLVTSLIILSWKHEAESRRKMTERALSLRKVKHTRSEVASMARRACGMLSLRHALANQIRSIRTLAEAGNTDGAAQRIRDLKTQAQVLAAASGERAPQTSRGLTPPDAGSRGTAHP